MSLEGDKIQWRGVRPTDPEAIFTRYEPPYGCTYVFGYKNVSGASDTLYTVPGNAILYLLSWGLSVYPTAAGYGRLRVKTGEDDEYVVLANLDCKIDDGKSVTGNFNMALQLPVDYYVEVHSQVGGAFAYGFFTGYTRPV